MDKRETMQGFRSESCLKKKEKSNAIEINRTIGRRDRKEGKERRKGKRRSKEFAISRVRCANNKPLGLKGRGA